MTVALAFILALATPVAAGERVLAGRPDEAAAAMAPIGLLGLFAWLASRSPLRVSADRIEVPRSRFARALGARRAFALAEVDNLYPTYYEDVGMRLSPFASAEGTAKHAGLAVEATEGKRVVVEFTPTVLNLRRHGTEPYHATLAALRDACARAGRPLVRKPPSLTEAQAEAMLNEASRPLLPFPVTVAGILAPSALIPGLVWSLGQMLGPLPPGPVLVAALAGLTPLLAVFAFVDLKSRRRADLLHEVQKWREHRKEAGARAPGPAQS
ncbi:MAG TPA: hypothetical protein VJ547_02925 [Candidatus Thermoplasmatota archaeon]|nr:hypothetical protein [Candidatus Thermoplasmatota archaeon]